MQHELGPDTAATSGTTNNSLSCLFGHWQLTPTLKFSDLCHFHSSQWIYPNQELNFSYKQVWLSTDCKSTVLIPTMISYVLIWDVNIVNTPHVHISICKESISDASTYTQAESLQHNLEQTTRCIDICMHSDKTEFILNDKPLKLVN